MTFSCSKSGERSSVLCNSLLGFPVILFENSSTNTRRLACRAMSTKLEKFLKQYTVLLSKSALSHGQCY